MRKWLAFSAAFSIVIVGTVAMGLTGFAGDTAGEPTTAAEAKPPTTTTAKAAAEETSTETAKESPKPTTTTTKVETDSTPPKIEILHPADGQVFEKKEVVFEGIAERGARVFAGRYEADVKDDGSWRIVLVLSPGANHATIKAQDAAGNVGSDSVTVVYQPPVKEEPKSEQGQDWKFSAYQVYGECAENPPYDVFHGTGKPGARIVVGSEFGEGVTEVNDHGEWEVRVYFPEAPAGKTFAVKVRDDFGNKKIFEFTRTG
jgi:hypothetical protein